MRAALAQDIRLSTRDRFHGAEATWAARNMMERVMIVRWLRDISKRPPLTGPDFEPLLAFLLSLATDLDYQVSDPDSPVVDGVTILQPHPDLASGG